MSRELPDSVARNVEHWTKNNVDRLDGDAASAWSRDDLTWGIFGIPEEALGSPLGDVRDLDVVELGCGTAYFGASRRTRRASGGRRCDARAARDRTAVAVGDGHRVPAGRGAGRARAPSGCLLRFCLLRYGASLWADPAPWVPEAARLLRPRGRLVFMTNSTISFLCSPDEGEVVERLMRPQAGMYRVEWPDEVGVEYHLSHSEWIDLLRQSGFEVERLIDVYAGGDSKKHDFYGYVTPEWARQWPAEEIWTARRRG